MSREDLGLLGSAGSFDEHHSSIKKLMTHVAHKIIRDNPILRLCQEEYVQKGNM